MCQCGLSIACGSLLYINTAESCSTKIVKSTQTAHENGLFSSYFHLTTLLIVLDSCIVYHFVSHQLQ
jgi:hypothetical protein